MLPSCFDVNDSGLISAEKGGKSPFRIWRLYRCLIWSDCRGPGCSPNRPRAEVASGIAETVRSRERRHQAQLARRLRDLPLRDPDDRALGQPESARIGTWLEAAGVERTRDCCRGIRRNSDVAPAEFSRTQLRSWQSESRSAVMLRTLTTGTTETRRADHESRKGKQSTPGRIRTYDLRIRSPLLYPAELRAQMAENEALSA